MTSRTHDLAAFATLTAVAIVQPLPALTLGTAMAAVVANLAGGIAPDIDQPTAPFWRNLPVGGVFGRIFDALVGGHRFLLHSLLGMALMGLALAWLLVFIHPSWPSLNGGVVWWSFMLGYISHLVMDSFTKEGVPWLLPIPAKFGFPPFKAWRITTGKLMESAVVFPLLVLAELWMVNTHYGFFVQLMHSLGR